VFVGASLGGTNTCCIGVGGTNTDGAGHYQLTVRAGTYRVNLSAPPFRHLVVQWWTGFPGGVPDFQHAADIVVGPADAPNTDFQAQFGVLLQGHVSDARTGAPLGGIGIAANNAGVACCVGLAFAGTDPTGNYAVVVPTHSRIIMFFSAPPDSRYIEQFWPNAPSRDAAAVIEADVDLGDINAQMVSGFFISGRVTDNVGNGLFRANVNVIDALAPCCRFLNGVGTDASGNYALNVLAGSYKIQFFGPNGTRFLSEFYNDRGVDFANGDTLVVAGDVNGI